MGKEFEVNLSNESVLSLDIEHIELFLSDFIDEFLKPIYKQTNDWNHSINHSIQEVEKIASIYNLSKSDVIGKLLELIEDRLAKDISELNGVDKIEILFENIDDYLENIQNVIKEGGSQGDIRLKVSSLVQNLNLFEISELLIHYANSLIIIDDRI